ncbi:MAG: hypothetical protein ACHQRJ_21545 [Alphaproteobacteria bacterium]
MGDSTMRNIFIPIIVAVACAGSPATAFEPTIKVAVENPSRPTIIGVTNLPDHTELMIAVRRKQSRFEAESKVAVSGGHFRSEPFSQLENDLNPGTYEVEVTMPYAMLQPSDARAAMGDNGENLSGPLVKRDQFGVTVISKTNFKVGSGDNAQLDAQARATEAKEMDRWIVDNCNSIIGYANRLAQQGVVSGGPITGSDRDAKVSACIKDLRATAPK